jgi:3-dehydroquinate synthetase
MEKQDMQRIIEMLAKIDAYQEKAEISHKEFLARLEDDRQAELRFLKEMMQMDTGHMEIMAEIKPEMTRRWPAKRWRHV